MCFTKFNLSKFNLFLINAQKKELDISKESTNIQEVIEDAIEHVNLILEDREGTIVKHFNAERTIVLLNEVHFINVIVNILENAIKYCRNVVRFVEGPNRFYYRSAFSSSDGSTFTRSNNILGFPTTIVDLGPRDEFIKEICIDKNLDPNCSVSRSIGPTSFKSFGELMGLAINYRMDVSNNEFEIGRYNKFKQ